ncbi:MAG: hypothetical protein JWN78_2158 [Bacteroidota bacterium]|nr:hypothetical protein [Bacteroidota bacterium]
MNIAPLIQMNSKMRSFIKLCVIILTVIVLQSCVPAHNDPKIAELTNQVDVMKQQIKVLKRNNKPEVINPVIITSKQQNKKQLKSV